MTRLDALADRAALGEPLSDDEVRELIDGGTRDGWSATIDRVTQSTAVSA